MRGGRRTVSFLVALSLIVGAIQVVAGAASGTEFGRYLVMFKEQPDTRQAAQLSNLNDRRVALYQSARDLASRTQGGVLSFLQQQQKVGAVKEITPLVLVNAVACLCQKQVVDQLLLRPEVESVSVDEIVKVPVDQDYQRALMWNIDDIKVRPVWEAGFSGSGVVIGNIDTGVEGYHPSLRSKYRGDLAAGDNDHSWFDALDRSSYPTDPSGHGTHTMGTIVGGSGPAPNTTSDPDIGVAYGARWIAARAFDSKGEGLTSQVLLAMQWMQFPTDSKGIPNPEKAPDVVSNSWSAGGNCRAWYSVALKMWRSANILPVFSVGDTNQGDSSTGPHSPGDLKDALSVGASDADGSRASFSRTGQACDAVDVSKPDIHAPGVGVYSSDKGSTFSSKSGTSMSAPHVAGAAALMIEAAGGRGSLSAMEKRVDKAIKESGVTACANCPLRLDVSGAVAKVRNTGVLRVKVQGSSGLPIAGAKLSIRKSNSDTSLSATTDAAGIYTLLKAEGTYAVTATAYGFVRTATSATVAANTTTNVTMTLGTATPRRVEGTVTMPLTGEPAVGVTVKLSDSPLVTTTAADGTYVFPAVPDPSIPDPASPGPNDYDYVLSFKGDPCTAPQEQRILIKDSGANRFDAALTLRRDSAGIYSCYHVPFEWKGGTNRLPLSGDDVYAGVHLPFAFPLYEHAHVDPAASPDVRAYSYAYISDNGVISFEQQNGEYYNVPLPNSHVPDGALYAFWDDLRMDQFSQVLTSSAADTFTIEWRDMTFHFPSEGRVTFSTTLHKNGDIEFKYLSMSGAQGNASAATVGIENGKGTIGFNYSHNEALIRSGLDIVFSPAAQPGDVIGAVTSNGVGLQGASVSASGAGTNRSTTTDSNGKYRLRLQTGPYSMTASKFHYVSSPARAVTVVADKAVVEDFQLTYQPGYRVSGVVRDVSGAPLAGVPISLGDVGIGDVRSDLSGNFIFTDVPPNTYTLTTKGSGRCRANVSRSITVSGDLSSPATDLQMTARQDGFGYRCEDFAAASWMGGDTPVGLVGDSASKEVDIGFIFPIYGSDATKAYVSVDGYVSFLSGSSVPNNSAIPNTSNPNLVLYPFWDDLYIAADSGVYTRSGSDFLVIEWRNVAFAFDQTRRVTFELILYANGNFNVQFLNPDISTQASGVGATIGSENSAGTVAFEYSKDQAAVSPALQICFIHPQNSTCGLGGAGTGVVGTVKEEITGNPVENVDVIIGNGSVTSTASTKADGSYGVLLPPGGYTLFASKTGYFSKQLPVTVPSSGFVTVDVILTALAKHTMSGRVLDHLGTPISRFEFQINTSDGRVIPIKADDAGNYLITLDDGTYDVVVWGSGRCQVPSSTRINFIQNLTHNVIVTLPRNSFGYTCMERNLGPVYGLTPLPMVEGGTPVVLPFDFPIYTYRSRTAYILPTGTIKFDKGLENLGPLAGPTGPMLEVFNDPNLVVDLGSAQVYMANPDSDTVVIEWRNLYLNGSGERLSFQAVLQRNGDIHFQYQPGNSARARGSHARIAVSCGSMTFNYLVPGEPNLPLRSGLGVYFGARFLPPLGTATC